MTTPAPLLFVDTQTAHPPARAALFGRLADSILRRTRKRLTWTPPADDSPCRSCVAFDIVAFGTRCDDDEVQVFVHRSLYYILEAAFDRAGIAWRSVKREDRGDGALVILPAGASPILVVGPLVRELATCLRRYNKLVSNAAQIRLRMAVHSGPVYADANGVVGRSLVHLFRMLDAPAFKHAMAAQEIDLGVVASERLYRDVIEPSQSTSGIGTYEPIEVILKETRSSAWLHLTDNRPPALRDLALPA